MLLVIEGADGSGKTTICKMLYEHLKHKKVILTRQPHAYRDIIVSGHDNFFLFWASRYVLLKEVLLPNKDDIIICDRYLLSSRVYQDYIDAEVHDCLEKHFSISPDYRFVIDVPASILKARLSNRENNKLDNIDKIDIIREKYINLAKLYNYTIINGNQAPIKILEEITKCL